MQEPLGDPDTADVERDRRHRRLRRAPRPRAGASAPTASSVDPPPMSTTSTGPGPTPLGRDVRGGAREGQRTLLGPAQDLGPHPGHVERGREEFVRRWWRRGPPRWPRAGPRRHRGVPSAPGTRAGPTPCAPWPRTTAVRVASTPSPSRVMRMCRSSTEPSPATMSSRVELVPQSSAATGPRLIHRRPL